MSDTKKTLEKNMKNYLKTLMELESEKYRLTQIINELVYFENTKLSDIDKKEFINYDIITYNKNSEINKAKISKLSKPVKPQEPIKEPVSRKVAIFLLVMSILFFYIPFSYEEFDSENFVAIGPAAATLALSISGFILCNNVDERNKQKEEQYKKDLDKYNTDLKIYEQELIEENEEIISKKINTISKKYEEVTRQKEELYEIKMNSIKEMREKNARLENLTYQNLELVNSKLAELYSLDIIFEKYRNLIAISMFYEYFASSRVSKLEGKDGAYNLFENEMRQNIIIVKLNDICNNLEDIKQNQYCMYKELIDINTSLDILNKNVSSITKNINNIDSNVSTIKEIDKCLLNCSNQINKNIETIKNITVANFLLK